MGDWLKEWADEKGYRAGWGDFALLDDARKTVDDLAESGLIDMELYEGFLKRGFTYRPKAGSEGLVNVIIISVPRSHNYVVFETADGPLRAIVPATYLGYGETRDRVRRELESYIASRFPKRQYRLENLSAPFKSVATRAGIVTYGRNNITYAPGCGSSHQLVGFFTDIGPEAPVEQVDPRATYGTGDSGCSRCEACVRACPTAALSPDRFTVRASRCVTHLNEYRGPWPEWLSPTAHNALVGCMRCQEVCPRNKGRMVFEPAPESFTREETEAILATADAGEDKSSDWTPPAGAVWESVTRKLTAMGLYLEPFLGRNLKALMKLKTV